MADTRQGENLHHVSHSKLNERSYDGTVLVLVQTCTRDASRDTNSVTTNSKQRTIHLVLFLSLSLNLEYEWNECGSFCFALAFFSLIRCGFCCYTRLLLRLYGAAFNICTGLFQSEPHEEPTPIHKREQR